jgi:hypothetical protein
MARIKVEELLESLDSDLRVALGRAVRSQIPNATFDERTLYKAFCKEAYRKCSIWESVPDQYVEK